MRTVSETFLRRLVQSHRSEARVSICDPSTFAVLAVLTGQDGYAIEGSVTMDRGRLVRRTCDVRIANPEGTWTPDALGDWLHINSLLRLERGIYLDSERVEWVTLGHFLCGRPRVEVGPAGATLAVAGEDRAKLLLRSRFTAPTTYAVGTRISAILAAEAQVAGMGTTRYRLNDGGKTLAAARTFEEDEPREKALRDLAHDYGLELYADADGYLTCSAPPDAETAPLAWSFAPGSGTAILLDLSREWTDDRLYNHVLVTGESADKDIPPVRAEAMDTNPASPAYVNGPLGDRLYRYTSAMITSTAQAQEVADNLLPTVALLEEVLNLGAVTNPALEPGDAIAVSEPMSKTAGRYLVETVQTPLHLGAQTIGAQVARSLGSALTLRKAARRARAGTDPLREEVAA